MIAGTSTPLPTPAAPTCTVRAAQSNETAFNTTITSILISAVNYFGVTANSSGTSVTVASGQVVDVTIATVLGAQQYNIYGYDGTHYYVHHFVPTTRWGKLLRRHHLTHHFADHDGGFGVSTPLWDVVFHTLPSKKPS